MVIGVSGGSGSGKTTFAKKMLQVIGPERASILEQDYYYKDQADAFKRDPLSVNFDHPNVIDFELMAEHLRKLKKGIAIECPIYDFKTHSRKTELRKIAPNPVILVEGILIFQSEIIFKELDLTFYMDAPENVRLERRIKRDTVERGRSEAEVRDQFFRQVKPMHDLYVEPTKKLASYILQT